jgi:Flp pilus assembly protein TadB
MNPEQIAKYEAWAKRLEDNIAALARQRRAFTKIFTGAVVVSALGFLIGPWLGVATFATGVMVCIAGVYISTTRTKEYERELAQTRYEIEKLRGA